MLNKFEKQHVVTLHQIGQDDYREALLMRDSHFDSLQNLMRSNDMGPTCSVEVNMRSLLKTPDAELAVQHYTEYQLAWQRVNRARDIIFHTQEAIQGQKVRL